MGVTQTPWRQKQCTILLTRHTHSVGPNHGYKTLPQFHISPLEILSFQLCRITNSPIADLFIVWGKVQGDDEVRGFILEKVRC